MIVEYLPNGQITHVMYDPIPPGLPEAMTANGHTFKEFPPIETEEGTVITSVDLQSDYLLDGQITTRPKLDLPSNVNIKVGETITLTGFPDRCNILVDNERVEVTGGTLELESEMPASYVITIDHFPYLSTTVTVNVDEG